MANGSNKRQFFYVSGGLLLILTCLHNGQGDSNGYGYDFPEYLAFFKGEGDSMYASIESDSGYDLEWPYYVYCKLLGLFFQYDFIYIMGIGLTIGIPFLYLVRKYSNNPALSIFLLLTILNTQTYLFFLSVHRQMLANTFIFLAYIVIESDMQRKKAIALLLLFLALSSHSSSFIIVPFLLVLWYLKIKIRKSYALIILGVTFLAGLFINRLLSDEFRALFFLMENSESLERSVHYIVDDVYEEGNTSFNILFPLTAITSFMVCFAKEEELRSFSMKCMLFTTSMYNLLCMIPLIDRGLTIFVLLGIVGAVPISGPITIEDDENSDAPDELELLTNDNNAEEKVINEVEEKNFILVKVGLFIILIMQIYLANKAYNNPSFRLLPFEFIWE